MSLAVTHPTNRPNFTKVTVGDFTVWFSYDTPIGFKDGYGTQGIATENVWGSTTGKHLNHFSQKTDRIPYYDFTRRYTDALIRRRLILDF